MLEHYLSRMAVATVVLGLALAGAPAHAQAQPGQGGGPQGGERRGRMGMSPEEQLERLSKALTLLMGIDPIVALTDIAGASRKEALDTLEWTARTLVEGALRSGS